MVGIGLRHGSLAQGAIYHARNPAVRIRDWFHVDANRRCVYSGCMLRNLTRFLALIAAYAFVLQALLAGLAFIPNADAAMVSAHCMTTSGPDQPLQNEQNSCCSHCLLAGCCNGGAAVLPASALFVLTPSRNVALATGLQEPRHVSQHLPQLARAPPLA